MLFVEHEVTKLQDILVHTFNSIACGHKVLIFILSLHDASTDFLDIVPLVFRLAHQNNPPVAMLVHDFCNPTIRPYASIVNKQGLSEPWVKAAKFFVDFLFAEERSLPELKVGELFCQLGKHTRRHFAYGKVVFISLRSRV